MQAPSIRLLLFRILLKELPRNDALRLPLRFHRELERVDGHRTVYVFERQGRITRPVLRRSATPRHCRDNAFL